MKIILKAVSILLGLYLIYQGIGIVTFTARGETIYRLGMLIPAQDTSLIIYGSVFAVLGICLASSPFIFRIYYKIKSS